MSRKFKLSTGRKYTVLLSRRSVRTGRVLVGIFNTERQQYEVYSRHQKPRCVPQGVDEYSLEIAFADALRVAQ